MTIEQFKKKFGIISKAKEIDDLVDVAMQVAPTDISILIFGESGTGKEIFARAIHNFSRRAANNLISVNCGAIPEGILESELFGHKRGSFTGATESRKGYFELANGGTLFLDEIAEMPLTTQVKLLRAIETKEFMKIGAETVTKVDVRFIAAANKDLDIEVSSKRFREDLYFRLKAVTLNIPPLRKRKNDIEILAQHFINNFTAENNFSQIKLTNEALNLLMEYSWPGNIRELKNVIETAIALSKNGILNEQTIISLLKIEERGYENRNIPIVLRKSPEEADRELIYRALFELKKDIIELKNLILDKNKNVLEVNAISDEVLTMKELEKLAIEKALKTTAGNKRKASKLLSISERTLYRKLKEYNIF